MIFRWADARSNLEAHLNLLQRHFLELGTTRGTPVLAARAAVTLAASEKLAV